ncbi:MAG TPA: HAD family hydrolase [Terriglobales bacterium]
MAFEAIFFDAGGTLVFPDAALTLAALAERNVQPTQEQLFAAEREAKHQLDDARAHGVTGVDALYWQLYYEHLLRDLGIADTAVRDALVLAARTGTNWRTVRAGTQEVLEALHSRYRIGLISNSDGSVGRLLEELGIGHCFDSVTDSHHCGCEKPDPRIFRAALDALGTRAERSLYVGDIYSVDFVGARSAGLSPLLMDIAGVYAETDYPRVNSLDQVEAYMTHFASP